MSEETDFVFDLGEVEKAPAKKAAKKAARKAAKKVAKKAAKKVAVKVAEDASGSSAEKPSVAPPTKANDDDGEFRPSDFKSRGSHFDGEYKVEVAPDVVVRKPKEAASDSSDEDRTEKAKSPEAKRESKEASEGGDKQRDRGGNQKEGQRGRQQGHGKRGGHQHNKQQGGQNRQKSQQQKGKKRGGGRQGGGGWQQPTGPKDADMVEGQLPSKERVAKFDQLKPLLEALDSEAEAIDLSDLYEIKVDPFAERLTELGLSFEEKPGRKQLLEALFKFGRESKRVFKDLGYLDVTEDGYGYVVHSLSSYKVKPESTYVPASLINHYGLKRGHLIEVSAAAPNEGERCPVALEIRNAMGITPEEVDKVAPFEDLIPYYPTERLVLETPMPSNSKKDVSMRAFDILTPIGFGQRGLIVAPPRTGKTVLLQGLANSIHTSYPQAKLIVLLIDERPEEVTDFKRQAHGEVVSSTFDETATSHVHAAEMVVEKARRLVEMGEHVIILLDSITRLARAYNTLASNSGKIMSGGIEATALQKPKRFFGSARNIEGAGSLTIIGTALVDTGSKMDEVIFEEFKGTGNMELHLDRDLINKRVFPAINFERSGTRKEELLYHPVELEKVYGLRRVMQGVPGVEAMEMLIKRMKATKSNAEFLMSLK